MFEVWDGGGDVWLDLWDKEDGFGIGKIVFRSLRKKKIKLVIISIWSNLEEF